MAKGPAAVLRGRQSEARRNDRAVLKAAREVFLENPQARVSDVAERAGVGQASIYRRFASKDALLNATCMEGMNTVYAAAEAALADRGDPWEAFAAFMTSYAESGAGTQLGLAGTFIPDAETLALGESIVQLTQQVADRAIAQGVLRSDVTGPDICSLISQLGSLRGRPYVRGHELQQRYLALILDGLRAPGRSQLPGRGPDTEELLQPWTTRR